MIHIEFTQTKKTYRNNYVEAMTLYYMRIYLITLIIGMTVVGLIARITGNETLTGSAYTMIITFIPVVFMCTLIAIGMALYDVRKNYKKYPEITEGNFKIRFEKNFMVLQYQGKNNKLHYSGFRYYRGFANSFVLHRVQGGSLVIPKNLVTKEQRKTIKQYIKAN